MKQNDIKMEGISDIFAGNVCETKKKAEDKAAKDKESGR